MPLISYSLDIPYFFVIISPGWVKSRSLKNHNKEIAMKALQRKEIGDKVLSINCDIKNGGFSTFYCREIIISFYRGDIPFRVEMQSGSKESCAGLVQKAFDTLIARVTKEFQGSNVNLPQIKNFISDFRDQEVLPKLAATPNP